MKKYNKLGWRLIAIGYFSSLLTHFAIKEQTGFIHSDSFWSIGMPLICAGIISIIGKQDLTAGIFNKVLLSIIILAWLFVVIASLFKL